MSFLQQLQAHHGGLIRFKTQICWYGGRGLDGKPGRVCLILDATRDLTAIRSARTAGYTESANYTPNATTVKLLIDGVPRWIWLADEDVEIL